MRVITPQSVRIATVISVLALFGSSAAPASAAEPEPLLTLPATTVCIGDPFPVSASGFTAGTHSLTVVRGGTSAALTPTDRFTVDASGAANFTASVAAGTAPGSYDVEWTRVDDAEVNGSGGSVTIADCTPPIVASTPSITGIASTGSVLTARTGTWSPGTTFTYRWLADGSPISGAVGSTFTITQAQDGRAISVEVTGTASGYTPATTTSAVTTRTLRWTTPTVTGTPVAGSTLTATGGAWTSGATLAYRWRADGVEVATGSTLSLTAAHVGRTITVDVTGTKSGHATVTASSGTTTAVAAAGAPTVAGTAAVGATLTAKPGSWTAGTAFTYQWLADGVAISRATAATFTPTAAEDGRAISVQITGTKAGHTTVIRTSPATVRVLRPATPGVTGAVAVGQTLTAVAGTWTAGTSFTYRWFADGKQIAGATARTLKLTSAQLGKAITVTITGSKAGHAGAERTSPATLRLLASAKPTVSGTPTVGATLTAKTGTWASGSTLTHQWFADGRPISGATKSTFTVTAAQDGRAISVRVTGTKSGHAATAQTSSATSRVLRPATPKITGTLRSGATITANVGTWTSGTKYSYRWFADGKAISGATGAKLKLTTATVGKRITVTVTGTRSGHATAARTSAATLRVLAAATPTISGSAIVGVTLTARAGTWTSGTKLSYQWFADGRAISGATASTFKVTAKQQGASLTVMVTGRKSGHATVELASKQTQRVLTSSAPRIAGSAKVGEVLTARVGSWTSGRSLSYAWYADGKAISGATGATFRPSAAHVGKRITVAVTGRLSGFATVSRNSGATSAVTYPARTAPVDAWTCPSWAPIKGNADSMIYHLVGGRYYDRTKPEECFGSVSAAVNAGYRASKSG